MLFSRELSPWLELSYGSSCPAISNPRKNILNRRVQLQTPATERSSHQLSGAFIKVTLNEES
jgi:hypothetical protein